MAAKIFKDLPGGLKMPAIGLGTGSLRDEADLERVLNAALELGYRHIDTAYGYKNEVFIGRVLKKWFSSGKLKREDIFITTKLPLTGIHQDRVELFMKKSLENLQLEYVDLYLIHHPIGVKYFGDEDDRKEIDDVDHIKIWKKMEEQVHLGRTKTIGLSNFNKRQIERIITSARIKPACLQVELHVDFQQRDLVGYCHKNGIVVVAYSPLGTPGEKGFKDRKVPEAINTDIVKNIAKKYNKSPGQIMLKYLLQKNIVPIPKSSSPERLKENISVFDFEINSEDIRSLDDLDGGETARLFTFNFIPGIQNHPEYPY
ncbi:aldo-keto reductase family 1 member C13-like [Anoplophora glabripennis]|uniref:aldo-keto reductase family 1 member C13-like n=1 Tax=Anoplophora glabripennis TaxID=217634 RepID=UPI000873D3E1|nr:aldo-keto reductase family 1 member C13-like [Anoplophora glabripennis]